MIHNKADYFKNWRAWVRINKKAHLTFETFAEAWEATKMNPNLSRIHFHLPTGECIRLVRDSTGTFRIVEDFEPV